MTVTDKETGPVPVGAGTGAKDQQTGGSKSTVLDLRVILRNIGAVEDMQKRSIQDMITMATANYWDRRAQTFEDARPQPGEFTGLASEDEVRAQDDRLAQLAEMCRFHARLMRETCDG